MSPWYFFSKSKYDVNHVLPNFHNMFKPNLEFALKSIELIMSKIFFNQTLLYVNLEGVAEKKSIHLLVVTQTFLKQYLGEAVLTATYLVNGILSRVLDLKRSTGILSKIFPEVSITYINVIEGNWIQELLNVFLWDTL